MSNPLGINQNTNKTRCIKGHPFDEANTAFYPNSSLVAGRRYCRECNRQNTNDFNRNKKLEEKREMGIKYQTLGTTEMDVWTSVAQGLTNPEISNELGYSLGHIENTINALFSRFNIDNNRVQLARMHWSNQKVNIRGL